MRTTGRKTDHDAPLSWDDLRTTLFLARSRSVRRAARTMGVSHSTVLRRVAALEKTAGVRLFERIPDGYQLTVAGQDVFDAARTLEDVVVALERRIRGRDHRLSGTVRVTLPDPLLPALAPVFRAFGRAYPGIEVTLAVATAYLDLANREADVAVRLAESPPPDLVGRRVGVAVAGVYGTKAYLARRRTRRLGALDWVGWGEGSPMLARWMTEHVPDARVPVRADAASALRDAVDAGIGVAIVPCALGEACGWKRVRLVPEIRSSIWILTHRDLRATTRVRVLSEFLADAIVKRRASFAPA